MQCACELCYNLRNAIISRLPPSFNLPFSLPSFLPSFLPFLYALSLFPSIVFFISPSEFDLLTVSETAQEPPQDEGNSINSPHNLALEATFINVNFSQQVISQ